MRISVVRRLCANTISCSLRFRNSAAIRRVSDRYDRRIPSCWFTTGGLTKMKNFSPRGAPLSDTSSKGCLDQRFSQFPRVGDRRGRADEGRMRSVMRADPTQPSKHVREMAAEHASIGVQLVDDDVLQVLEQLRPPRMMRQDARMDHVRVAQHHVRPSADRPPRILRRVPVVCEHADLELGPVRQLVRELMKLGELILRERLGRKQIQRTRRWIPQHRAEDGRVVAERFARSGRRGDDDVAPGEGVLDRGGLMRVGLIDAAGGQHVPKRSDRARLETLHAPLLSRAAGAPP